MSLQIASKGYASVVAFSNLTEWNFKDSGL